MVPVRLTKCSCPAGCGSSFGRENRHASESLYLDLLVKLQQRADEHVQVVGCVQLLEVRVAYGRSLNSK